MRGTPKMVMIKASLVKVGDRIKRNETEDYAEVMCVELRENTLLIRFHLKRLSDSDKPYIDVVYNDDVLKQ